MLRAIMSQSTDVSAIGFPPPVLGKDPLRLPVIADSADWLALDKPAGIGVRDYPWDQQVPDLDTALNLQLRQGKPELKRLEATLFGSVCVFSAKAVRRWPLYAILMGLGSASLPSI